VDVKQQKWGNVDLKPEEFWGINEFEEKIKCLVI
jgi:hypothetical protein